MTKKVEDAFVERAARLLADRVTRDRFFIGEAPLLDAAETAEILHPFVFVRELSIDQSERTNETTTINTASWLVGVAAVGYDEAKEIALKLHDELNRADFAWGRGNVADMKFQGQTDRQEEDGSWLVSMRWKVLYSITAA